MITSIVVFCLGVVVGSLAFFFFNKNNKSKVAAAEKIADELKLELELLKAKLKK